MGIHRHPLGDVEHSPGSQARTPARSLAKGTVLRARYRVTGTRSTRHFATVYDAEDVVTARSVALTVLHETPSRERARVAELRRTGSRVTATLASPPRTFVMVDDCDFTEDGHLFLVTEPVEGRTLHDILNAPEKNYVQALELVMRAGEALTWALDVGFVDLRMALTDIVYVDGTKGAKVLGTEALALRDLGLAKRLARSLSSDPDYAWSPEEREGYPPTEQSAVYRFGTLLRLIVGTHQSESAAGGTDRQLRLRTLFFQSDAWYSRDSWSALEHLAARLTEPEPLMRPTDLRPILNELFEVACRLQFSGRDAKDAEKETLRPWRDIGRAPARIRAAWVAIPALIVTMALIASVSIWIGQRPPMVPPSLEDAQPAAPAVPTASIPPPEISSRSRPDPAVAAVTAPTHPPPESVDPLPVLIVPSTPAAPPTVRHQSPGSSDAIAHARTAPHAAKSPMASDVPTRATASAIAPNQRLSMPPAVGTIEAPRPPAPSLLGAIDIDPPHRPPTPPQTERQAPDPGAIIDWLIEHRNSLPE
jgi:serine/threonine protein kinase